MVDEYTQNRERVLNRIFGASILVVYFMSTVPKSAQYYCRAFIPITLCNSMEHSYATY